MTQDSAAEVLRARVQADLPMWRDRGIGVSTWGVDPDTGDLHIGVRTPASEATEPLQERYGAGTHVYYADVRPAGRPFRAESAP